jgi:hypothetical protein
VGGDSEQAAAAEGTFGCLHAVTDLALDHRWPEAIGGLDLIVLVSSPLSTSPSPGM